MGGDFPVICVKTMAKIAKEAEACIWNERIFEDMMRTEAKETVCKSGGFDCTSTAAISAVLASYKSQASAIVVLTTSGATSHMVSKYKPQCPILSVTRFERVARQMQLHLLRRQRRRNHWLETRIRIFQYCQSSFCAVMLFCSLFWRISGSGPCCV